MDKTNPIIDDVVSRYKTIKNYTKIFTGNNTTAIRGLLISGDAGFGKTHYTKLGLMDAEQENIDYIKGSSISAAALFVKLYQSRLTGQVLILDDVDIIGKNKGEFNSIIDLIKGATEPSKNPEDRTLSWDRASRNQMMVDNDVPTRFVFDGTMIWITNEKISNLAKKAGTHWSAIDSRFYKVEAWLNNQEKLMYTLHLVEEIDILGKECYAREKGYDKTTIERVIKYLRDNRRYMFDFNDNSTISPRSAIKLADTMVNFPNEWEEMADMQFIK